MKKLSLCLCASVFNNKSMEKAVYYFNPENDMALANFTPYYKAPAEIVRMADELAERLCAWRTNWLHCLLGMRPKGAW